MDVIVTTIINTLLFHYEGTEAQDSKVTCLVQLSLDMEDGDTWVPQTRPCRSGASLKYPVSRNVLVQGQHSILIFQKCPETSEVTSNTFSLLGLQTGLLNSTNCSLP